MSDSPTFSAASQQALHPGDESRHPDGSVRESWRYVLDAMHALGPQGLAERHQKARRILRDDGVTYNIYSTEHGAIKAWELDLVPFVIGSDDWAKIESGLLERAELFNLILEDIYGERELIKSGTLPPEAIFAHGGFLRACHGIKLAGAHQLILHAVDMARLPSGELCVFADRCQSPSGAGYALENRTVMSRVLPSMFRDSQVHRLARFFQRLRVKLSELVPHTDEPRVVVLTPGAHNETYFEHTYLANYLGYPLVQSGDLIVRNGFVWMKSLEGLSRVDVILRRVDDVFCDPLELRSDSQLGVAGLLDVARLGRVAIVNPLGAGVLENPVLLKYLPQISRRLLGREPRLASVATYWCGAEDDMKLIKSRFDELVIKPIYRGSGGQSILPATLSAADKQALLERISSQPYQFVAQELISHSRVPTLVDGQLKPLPTILRSFAVADKVSYSIMPGGLARVGQQEDSYLISNQLGSINKDIWVVASEPERQGQSDMPSEKFSAQLQGVGLPSRVVENLFWFGRYAERAESSLRVLRTVFVMLNSAEPLPEACRKTLLSAVSEVTDSAPGFKRSGQTLLVNPEPELLAVLLDGGRMGSVKYCLNAMLNCAEESKELLSSDFLRVINDIRDGLDTLSADLKEGLVAAPEEALDPLVTALMALSGLSQESMVRGTGWRFMEIGRRLERGLQTESLLRTLLGDAGDEAEESSLLLATLSSLEVLMTYRRRYRARMDAALVLELVLLDTSNPRSLLFQFEQLQSQMNLLPEMGTSSRELQAEQRAVLEAITTLRLKRLVELAEVDSESGRRECLDQTLSHLHQLLSSIGAVLSDKYFDLQVRPQQLVRAVWEG